VKFHVTRIFIKLDADRGARVVARAQALDFSVAPFGGST
jgi:hypothetical protein